MVGIASALVPLIALPFAMAQTPQVTIYRDIYYQGESVDIPADGGCHDLAGYQPNLERQVSSIQIPLGFQCILYPIICLGGVIDVDGVTVDAPGTNSLYNYQFNDATVSIACYPAS
ncbi:hypothetical protein ASPBRDRAFT_37156 [Aspergillus brasiliensis CBS 101740]|uniref:Uncharacterized protein n=1 Tax=Aspergillus brasiliensis (strain CBS 101740 / IMI 381727 / IBT 21946) TaxID=767769 RepID=A0A1L9V1U0_ASPBC|nr:hypothetical protein ASPBRDRAFT_37156 [Aspergillus brasiliensis CBS 101740]